VRQVIGSSSTWREEELKQFKVVKRRADVKELIQQIELRHTKSYNFSNIVERGEWVDVFVALIRYLVSGESKVGFLNNKHSWNLIHKVSLS
jgi:hypothetical protein